jgi:hypothetical protein
MSVRRMVLISLCHLVVLMSGCQKSQPSTAKVSTSSPEVQPAAAPAQSTQVEAGPNSPPAKADLRDVIARTYKNAVILDESRATFVVGDFNNDSSEDIAIVVKPDNQRLTELNSEFANWILEDPNNVGVKPEGRDEHPAKKPAATVVRPGDTLLAVVHGYQNLGWRNPKATQTYLLKIAISDRMETQPARLLISESSDKKDLPLVSGDVIRERPPGAPGFLYWTGAKYAWFRM